MALVLPAAAKADILRRLAGAIAFDKGDPGPTTRKTLEELADEYGAEPVELRTEIAQKHGWPKVESMRKAADLLMAPKQPAQKPAQPGVAGINAGSFGTPTPAVEPGTRATVINPQPDKPADLRARAAASPKARTRRLGEKVTALLAELEQILQDEEKQAREAAERTAAQAEAKAAIERLERELAEAKAKLKPPARTQAAKRTTAPTPNVAATAAEIRAWAAANKVTCPSRGIIPNAVRAAYDTAHQAKGAA